MNMTDLVSRIKRTLGLYVIATPFENVNELITDIIADTTLPVFSTVII